MAVASASILLVDDDDDFRESVKSLLEAVRYRVVGACSGNEAMLLLAKEDFDLVITDIVMPNGGGMALVTALLQQKSKTANPPGIIIVSGTLEFSLPYEESPTMKSISKPFRSAALFALCREILSNRETSLDKAIA